LQTAAPRTPEPDRREPHAHPRPDTAEPVLLDDALTSLARKLAARKSMSAREFAERTGMSEPRARATLAALVEAGHARQYKDGRSTRYFARRTGARPDLGLGKHVAVVRPAVNQARVHELARDMERTKLLGLLGEDELFESAHLFYRPVYQIAFEEHIERTGLKRLIGPDRDQVVGTVYCHPRTLQILVFTARRGIEFSDQPGEYASRVDDFDGVATFDDVPPGTIDIDEEAWKTRRDAAAVKKHFRGLFRATPRTVTPYFVPLWRVMMHQRERGNYRVVVLDAVVGRPVSWP
jgi:DNA-binding transcriptional ArsR family regulator